MEYYPSAVVHMVNVQGEMVRSGRQMFIALFLEIPTHTMILSEYFTRAFGLGASPTFL